MTYYELENILRSNYIKPNRRVVYGLSGKQTTGLMIDTPPIAMDEKIKKINSMLVGRNVRVTKFPNEAYILVEIVK